MPTDQQNLEDLPRGAVLKDALHCINGERVTHYGAPEDSFAVIGEYWTSYLGREVTAKDVTLMMTLFKIAREQNQHKRDNLVDACGYLAIAGDMAKPNQEVV